MNSLFTFAKGVLLCTGAGWCMVSAVMMILNGSCSSGWGLISMISLLLIGWETLKGIGGKTFEAWKLLKAELNYDEVEEEESEEED